MIKNNVIDLKNPEPFVDDPIQIFPFTLDFDIGFISPIRIIGRPKMGLAPLLYFRGICLKPAVDGRVIAP